MAIRNKTPENVVLGKRIVKKLQGLKHLSFPAKANINFNDKIQLDYRTKPTKHS